MIRPLRQLHRLCIPLLLVALVPALGLAWLQRPPPPVAGPAPAAAAIRIVQASASHRRIEIQLPASLPEVLAYWVPPGQSGVNEQAVLIGRPAATRDVLELPDALPSGQILLYSLPLQQVIATQALPAGSAP